MRETPICTLHLDTASRHECVHVFPLKEGYNREARVTQMCLADITTLRNMRTRCQQHYLTDSPLASWKCSAVAAPPMRRPPGSICAQHRKLCTHAAAVLDRSPPLSGWNSRMREWYLVRGCCLQYFILAGDSVTLCINLTSAQWLFFCW